ncbi:LuxR family transcriptional regulator [Actinomadura rubrobrunea]|uniref:LuxR family transcriptional regulator n=1 Tax=Actinomadura rubrobrunea TaxID=115335 RepID=A0A9W6PXW6_9ACTN|nr:LuxR family transcriptional regulator [Actinomadura rubrobrunea]GLW65201.1 LuxR family transcriptional regulator [Actinomadura rubrobrunea]
MYGRDAELAEIDRLLADARDGRSGVLVVRGEAGIGKSTLLQHAARAAESAAEDAAGMLVLRATGVEAEKDIPFAGLHQLLWPVQERIGALPDVHAHTLHTVLGVCTPRECGPADRFAAGLALLTLLADLAEKQPVLCLVDDLQWIDRGTTDALLFTARRLTAEGVAMLFATRDETDGSGLPELRPRRLARADASRLLRDQGLPAALHDRVYQESAGNPLALIEFAAARRGRPDTGVDPLPVADRVLASFRTQIAGLPERTRLMLLIAAAEGRGHMPALLRAAELLGVTLDDLAPAEQAGLVEVSGSSLDFRHPLVRSAAYQDAPSAQRMQVHQALADSADDPGCRVRHRASAVVTPDEHVAAALEEQAAKAQGLADYDTAAALYRRAARLTPGLPGRARRLRQAASAVLRAGHAEAALALTAEAKRSAPDPAERARLAAVRAAVEYERGDPHTASQLLLDHAADVEPDEAEAMLRTAAAHAWTAGQVALVQNAAERLRALGRPDKAVDGLARIAAGDHATGLPLLAELVAETRAADAASPGADTVATVVDRRVQAVYASLILGDDDATLELAAAHTAYCRGNGLVGALPDVLRAQAQAQIAAGRHRDAESTAAEALALARDIGMRQVAGRLAATLARVAAIEGDEQRVRDLLADASPSDAGYVLGLLDLGLGRHADAVRRFEEVAHHLVPADADLVEAAVRAGTPDRAREPLKRFERWADAGGQPWALAVAARCRALLDDSEDHYREAVRLHTEHGGRPFERARTQLLYGEWLRRSRRRSDARAPLRSALETFERLRATPWVERARAELRATGETGAAALATAPDLLDRLTPQERQVVRLAADGVSSREIASQLFLSPRTVEYHLYKAYPKLGVSSRRELSRLLADQGRAAS